MRKIIFVLVATLLAGCESGESPEKLVATAAQHITADVLREHVRALSEDRLEGRGPGSTGDLLARQYLANQLQFLGFQPAGADGSWEQSFELVGINARVPDTWVFRGGDQILALQRWEQFIAASGVQEQNATVADAEIVFVGYGIQAPEYDWDDFKGQDLRGKVLLILNNDPDWDPELFAGETRLFYGRWVYKYQSAARQGAAGAIIIHTDASAGYPWQVVQTSWTGEQFELPAAEEPRIEVAAWVTQTAARDLLALRGHDLNQLRDAAKRRDFEPVALGIKTSIAFKNELSGVETANVLGIMPGSDPTLRDEVVIYTAHHDHLGVGGPDDAGDRIYNGARDNGAGMAQVLAIARAMQALPEPPRRSIMMLFVGAEEQGLLGSAHYATNPTYPPGKIAANINYDGGNIWGKTRDVMLIGLGKSTLDKITRSIVEDQGRVLTPDQFPDRGYYYRSDQFSFARIGVPGLFFRTGTDFVGRDPGWGREQIEAYEAVDYHQPSDELNENWNFDGMVDDARLGFRVGVAIANVDDMPSWVPGDEFEAARLKAIADLIEDE